MLRLVYPFVVFRHGAGCVLRCVRSSPERKFVFASHYAVVAVCVFVVQRILALPWRRSGGPLAQRSADETPARTSR